MIPRATKEDATAAFWCAVAVMALCLIGYVWTVAERDKDVRDFINCVTVGGFDPQTCKDASGF